jgi:hypothetical protein
MMHVFRIIELDHRDYRGMLLGSARNLLNTFHSSGEEFVLRAAFLGGKKDNAYIPVTYYFGLDDRKELKVSDTMQTVQDSKSEPSGGGYRRSTVPSLAQFKMVDNSSWAALSPVVYFAATKKWAEVRNIFVTDQPDYSGYLIASVMLDKTYTLDKGQSISMRVGIQLKGG